MATLATGLELYQDNRFEEAMGLYRAFLNESDHDQEEYEEAFQKLLMIYDALERHSELLQTQKEFFSFLVKGKKFSEACELFEKILEKESSLSLEEIHSYWLALVHAGYVSKAVAVAEKYLERLLAKKNVERGLHFLNDLESLIGERELVFAYRLPFLYLKKDYDSLKKVCAEQFSLLFEKREFRKNKYLVSALDFLAHQTSDEHPDFRLYVLKAAFLRTQGELTEERVLKRRKKLIHQAINMLLDAPLSAESFETLLLYVEQFKRKELAHALLVINALLGREITQNKKIKKLLSQIQEALGEWPETQMHTGRDKAKKKTRVAQKPALKEQRTEIKPISLSPLIIKENEGEEEKTERMLKSFLRYLAGCDQAYLKKYYRDLVTVFFNFHAPSLACEFLHEMRLQLGAEESWSERLNLEYLYIIALEKAGKNYEALIVIDEVINSFPLVDEEKICFYYLKGEVCQAMGRKVPALTAFRFVEKQDPHYRCVKQRIKELAKS